MTRVMLLTGPLDMSMKIINKNLYLVLTLSARAAPRASWPPVGAAQRVTDEGPLWGPEVRRRPWTPENYSTPSAIKFSRNFEPWGQLN